MTENADVQDASLNIARDFCLEKIRGWYAADSKFVADCHETPEDALRWFCCFRDASLLRECNRVKDWAHMLQDGIKPMSIQGELDSFIGFLTDDDELNDDWKEELLPELEAHFGIDPEELQELP